MPDVATNKQAAYRYHLMERWEAGLVLTGTEVPTRLYFKGPRAKVEIALARGKDVGDKRQAIKEREMKREMERAIRR